jgi:hypothetical protein
MRQDLPHFLVPSRRGGVDGKYFIVSQTSAFQALAIFKVPEFPVAQQLLLKYLLHVVYIYIPVYIYYIYFINININLKLKLKKLKKVKFFKVVLHVPCSCACCTRSSCIVLDLAVLQYSSCNNY